jgi:hypothetical protein
MYPKASIKLRFLKGSCQSRVKIANKVSSIFDKHFRVITQSHEQRCAIRPLVHWLIQKTSHKKRGNPEKCKQAYSKDIRREKRQPRKTHRGLFKRPPMKKEATPKNAKGLIQKPYDKKEATLKNIKGLIQKTSDKNRGNPEKCKGAYLKDL